MTAESVLLRSIARDHVLRQVVDAAKHLNQVTSIYADLFESFGDQQDRASKMVMKKAGNRLQNAQRELNVLLSRLCDAHRAVVLAEAETQSTDVPE